MYWSWNYHVPLRNWLSRPTKQSLRNLRVRRWCIHRNKTSKRGFARYEGNSSFLWILFEGGLNEKYSYNINLTNIHNYWNRTMVLSTIRLGTSYICMKSINTLVLDVTIYILDFLYRGRDFQRFWVLEVIARAPYFSFISVLHFRESLGLRAVSYTHLTLPTSDLV